MGKIYLVAESGSDVTPDLQKQYDIRIAPMHVNFGKETKEDGTFPPSEVIDYYNRTKTIPTTSGAMTYDFANVFDAIIEEDPNPSVLHIAYSVVTTCSYECARQAAEERPQMKFVQVDSQMFSYGQYSVIIRTAQMLAENPDCSLEEAAAFAQDLTDHACMCFVPDGFDFLKAGGRVKNATALVGELLKIHPMVKMVDGYLIAGKKYRGSMNRVLPAMIRDFIEEYETRRPEIWLGHTPAFSDEHKALAEKIVRELGFTKIHWIECGSIITTHGGTGCFGLSGFGKNQARERAADPTK